MGTESAEQTKERKRGREQWCVAKNRKFPFPPSLHKQSFDRPRKRPDSAMNSAAENLDIAKRMFMEVIWWIIPVVFTASAFYTDTEYVIADYLVRNKYLRDDDVQNDTKLLLHHKWVGEENRSYG